MFENGLSDKKRKNITPFIFFGIGLVFILLGYVLTRAYFFWANGSYFSAESSTNILLAFLYGLRFDFVSIALLNTPLILMLYVMVWFRRLVNVNMFFVLYYLLLVNVPAIIINFIDTVYFPYTGRRSGPEVFSMANDVGSQLPELIVVYWGYAISAIFIFLSYVFLFSKLRKSLKPVAINKHLMLFFCFFLTLVFIIAGRGGLQSKPIRALNAYSYPSSSLGALVLNTPFSLLREDADHLKRVSYFLSNNEIEKALDSEKHDSKGGVLKKHNVVILILESFGLEYFGPPYGLRSYAPFLEQLTKKGRFFPNGIANGRRSIEAVPSILAGIPSLMSEAYMRSPYQSNTLYGLGEIVQPYGYSSAFFHGANNGSMYFDDTTYRFGFSQYYGRDEYPDSSQYDGQWGIFDEPFLQFVVDELDEMPKPFMAGVFTISSHPPYTLPKQYEKRIPKGDIPMHRVIQYSDIALQRFFETASTKDWYKDTLFVITADHTSDNFDRRFASSLGRHQIPIILYQPNEEIEKGVITEIAQQIDIPATIVDYLNLPEEDKILPFGRSLLTKNNHADAIFKEDDAFWLLSQGKYVKLPMAEKATFETGDLPSTFVKSLSQENPADIEQLENRLKAYVQIYTNGLIDNSLYRFSPKKSE